MSRRRDDPPFLPDLLPREVLSRRGSPMFQPPGVRTSRRGACEGCGLEEDLVPGWLACDPCVQLARVSFKILNGREMRT